VDVAAPFENPFISRAQLGLSADGRGVLVENAGKRRVLVDGLAVDRPTMVRQGGVVEIEGQLLLLCVERELPYPPSRHVEERDWPPFGAADAQGVVGESEASWALRDRLAFAARSTAHVLVHGPSGTGKELVAHGLHSLSPRASKKMVARNAATFPPGIVDAELFGNVANYPNAGMAERPGVIGQADGSTLFLDEIGELPVELQSRLLRVLDSEGDYQRLGDARPRRSDLRLVAATNRAPEELRPDLLARFAIRVEVAGLDDRLEDVPLLARRLLQRTAQKDPHVRRFLEPCGGGDGEPRLDAALVRALVQHAYATNVRELQALLWRSVATSPGDVLELTDEVRAGVVARPPPPATTREHTAEEIREALARCGGVQERAWRELGMASRYVLKRAIRKHGIAVRPGDDD
jgi:two-component system nitrogen regulation response regulator GlnG/two-component system response regulator HydG